MPRVQQRGLSFHTQVLGDEGPPVVMLHGLLVGSLTTWYFGAAPRLARAHRVLLYDLRGHGKSDRPASGYDVATMTGDLEALLDDFSAEPATLVGHSYGALVALRLALRRPERVRRLALVEAPLPPAQVGELGAFLRRAPEDMAGALPDELRATLARGGRAATAFLAQLQGLAATTLLGDLAAEGDIPDDALACLRCPTLLVYGARSSCRATGIRLARVLPDARLVELPGGHFLPTEQGAAVTEALEGFCRG
jgi:pimeloyl-ACP methyl ester carboxylesterase